MSYPKDLNSPSPWNMRIWDEAKHQWLCDGEDDVLAYYGFDIRGGEVTAMQSMDWVYRQFERGRKLIWERSTGLTDKNGKEIYEGDIVEEDIDLNSQMTDGTFRYKVYWNEYELCWSLNPIGPESIHDDLWELNSSRRVIGNIHEKDKLVDFDHVKGGEE